MLSLWQKGHRNRDCPNRPNTSKVVSEPTSQEPKKSGVDQEKTIPTEQKPTTSGVKGNGTIDKLIYFTSGVSRGV